MYILKSVHPSTLKFNTTLSILNNIQKKNYSSIIIYPTARNQILLHGKNTTQFKDEYQKRHFSLSKSITDLWTTVSRSVPVAYFQDGLVQFHDFTSLPWWTTIIISTFLLRTLITLPLAIYQNKIVARLELIATVEMPNIVVELKREATIARKKYNLTDSQTRIIYNQSLKKQYNKLIVRDNCHPLKSIIVLYGQIPLWIIQSISIRNLVSMLPDPSSFQANLVYTELSVGGFGWIPNLTELDCSYILPVTLGILNLAIIEVQSMSRTSVPGKVQKYVTHFFRIISIILVPIAASVPSCLCLYWTASSAYGLGQNLLLMSPTVKQFLKIPKTKTQLDNPYKHLRDAALCRLDIFKWTK